MQSYCTSLILPTHPFCAAGRKLESEMRKAVYDFSLFEETKIGIALSGGKDSLTLLFLLKILSGKGFPKLDLHAFHVEGEFSCGPGMTSKYLKELCEALDIPLTIRSSTQTREGLACYSCSRERRRLLFTAAKEHGYKTLAFGHHADDSIQTFLLNLLHKGEVEGNLPKVPMHDYGVTIIRPLIYSYEKEILAFATHYNFLRITCQCPVGQNSMRKEVARLVETMEASFPNARVNLSLAHRTYGTQKALKTLSS
ncbi:MAG: tRNA 2-thiocytidine biosynthesis protein TtcA [Verrucomicrobia bacterium]|nr:tRNA 2-thiocytidine biosynthesis protein TtcA [Verrucomicrobiota bacterium]